MCVGSEMAVRGRSVGSYGRWARTARGLVCAAAVAAVAPAAAADDVPVDLELVLAVDVSGSIDPDEALVQRIGYRRALLDPEFLSAVESGPLGRIAVTYVEWAGRGNTRKVVDWTVIDGAESAAAFVAQLAGEARTGRGGTSISGVLYLSASMFDHNGYDGARHVVDVSGDGANNAGGNVAVHRDLLAGRGFTINGLAILDPDGPDGTRLPDLDVYYRECVAGGPGAFVVVADGFPAFAEAVRRKLLLEVAGVRPPGGVAHVGAPRLIRAQGRRYGIGPKYAPECNIGEILRWERQQERLRELRERRGG